MKNPKLKYFGMMYDKEVLKDLEKEADEKNATVAGIVRQILRVRHKKRQIKEGKPIKDCYYLGENLRWR